MFNMFEGPWLLICVAVGVWMGLVIAVNFGVDIRRFWLIVVPLVIAGCGFAVDHFIETDMEKIEAIVYKIVDASEQHSPERIEPLLSDGYSDGIHPSKEYLMMTCRDIFRNPFAEKIVTRFISVEIDGSKAEGEFSFLINLDQRSHYAALVGVAKVKLKVEFERTPTGDWFVKSSEPTEVNNQSFNWRMVR